VVSASPTPVQPTSSMLAAFGRINDTPLVFGEGPGQQRGRHLNPLVGILQHGPYAPFPSGKTIRVATITAADQQQKLFSFLKRLHQPARATDRPKYVPDFPGFETAFRVHLRGVAEQRCHVQLAPDTPEQHIEDPHTNVVQALSKAIHALRDQRDKWDVIAILLPTRWEHLRKSADGRFDLHDRIKATVAPLGIPVQFLWENSALATTQWCSTAWRLSLAFFAKAGGIPWRIAPTTSASTAYVGLHWAIRGGTRNEFVTCCSQVFDAQGGGMEFVAYNLGSGDRDHKNQYLTREEMRVVMSRTADLYRHRHAGAMPQRFVIHKASDWREEEIDGVFDAWAAARTVECITLQNSRWRGVELKSKGTAETGPKPATMAVKRGTLQLFDGSSGLLWTRGPSRVGNEGQYFSPDGKSLPRPIAPATPAKGIYTFSPPTFSP
jgi:hypothetical protein